MKIIVNDIKVPSRSDFRKIRPLSGKSLLSAKGLGTNKPLLTSFQIKKTDKLPSSYGCKRNTFSFLGIGGNLAKLSLILLVSLLSPYLSGIIAKASGVKSLGIGAVASASVNNIDIWWPLDQAALNGVQPFKTLVTGKNLNEYKMYWQVDGGGLNQMYDSSADYPHKEAIVDLSGWNWKSAGPYTLRFTAFDLNGQKVSERTQAIYIKQNSAQPAAPSQDPVSASLVSAALPPPQPSSCPAAVANAFMACYFSDQNLSNFVLSRVDQAINFGWGAGSPDAKIPTDHFSARWQGNFNFSGGNYDFTATADDGVRVYIDNNPIIDQWKDQAATTYNVTKFIAAGAHNIRMEYYENAGGAVAKLSWVQTDAQAASPVPAPVQLNSSSGNPLGGMKFYLNPDSAAKKQADAWRSSRPQDAAQMDKIASQPAAVWFGSWNGDVKNDVNALVGAAQAQNSVPVLVIYNIPNRDCGGYSAGGAQTPDSYKQWINALAVGIGNRKAAVILEPDSVALINCLSGSELQTRYDLLKSAVATLKSLANTAVYIDAGHANWNSADEMADRLRQAGIDKANGFALNVSNFTTIQDNTGYGQSVSAKLGGKHFVIDTSRNGNGPAPDGQWCNPPGRALGARPTTNTGNPSMDAILWGKIPGESDGSCGGGPSAGVWWADYALGLAQRAAW